LANDLAAEGRERCKQDDGSNVKQSHGFFSGFTV
jgi:hypothetical protein